MRRLTLILALTLVVAACGDDDSGTTGTTTAPTVAPTTTAAPTTPPTTEATTTSPPTTEAAAGSGDFEITTVGFGDSPMLVITNVGAEPGNLAGHWLCQRPAYYELPDVELGPGEFLALSLGGSDFEPPAGAVTVEEEGSIGGIRAESGEVALYDSGSFGSADSILSYVEWGTTGHGRSGTAVEAGIWDEGGFVETTGDEVTIDRTDLETTGSAAWTSS